MSTVVVEKSHVVDVVQQGEEAGDLDEDGKQERRVSESVNNEIIILEGVVSDKESECESSFSTEGCVEVDLEEVKVHLSKVERDCRICHLSMDATNEESGVPIELGCSCKDDLAAAHKQCAEAWFKIKGNKTCEICGFTAHNVVGPNENDVIDHWNEANDVVATPALAPASVRLSHRRKFWQGHRFLNFLLACMVFAFVISWLFHFNVPS